MAKPVSHVSGLTENESVTKARIKLSCHNREEKEYQSFILEPLTPLITLSDELYQPSTQEQGKGQYNGLEL